MLKIVAQVALPLAVLALSAGSAEADKIKNTTAVFSGLDKITGRIVSFEVAVDETVQFGALQLTPRVCYTRPPTESPNTTTFVEVDEIAQDGNHRRIFAGWMFAASPGLHGLEHPVYDLWLIDCKGGTETIVEPKDVVEEPPLPAPDPSRRRPNDIIAPPEAGEQIGVAPPRGTPVQPQVPARRFFPVNPQAPILNNNRLND